MAATLAVAACGSAPQPAPTPTPPPRGDGSLAIGITEENPAFLTGSPDPAFDRWRLSSIRPAYVRLVVDWAKLVDDDGTLDPDRPQGGCLRTIRPCAGWFGVSQQLKAIATAQRDDPGRYRVMAVIFDTPSQHASAPGRCSADAEPRSRPPRDLAAYRDLIAGVLDQADAAGVDIELWAPWNEPNGSYFLAACDQAEAYLRLVNAMREVVGDDELVLGELAGWDPDVFRTLPKALICDAAAFGVHDYAGGSDPLPPLERAIDDLHCDDPPPIWITETGGHHDRFSRRGACRADQRDLERWYADPRVEAAFHYTLREDDRYPTGLVSTDLQRAFPALAVWQAWGTRPDPASPPPAGRC